MAAPVWQGYGGTVVDDATTTGGHWSTTEPTTGGGLPSGLSAGDVMLAFVTTRDNSYTVATPNGWTPLVVSTAYCAVFGRAWQSGDTAPSFDFTNATSPYSVVVARISGADTDPTHWVVGTPNTGTSGTVPAPAVDTPVADSLVIRLYYQSDNNTVSTPPGSHTEGVKTRTAIGTDAGWAVYWASQASQGTTGTANCVFSGSDPYWGETIAIGSPHTMAQAITADATASGQDPAPTTLSYISAQAAEATSSGAGFILSDDFNYGATTLANGTVEGQWAQGSVDPWETTGTQAYAPTAAADRIAVLIWETPGLALPRTKGQVDWISGNLSVMTRLNGSTGYGFGRYGTDTWRLTKHVSGVVTVIGNGAGTESTGSPIWVLAEGTAISGDANYGGVAVQVTDTSITPVGATGNGLWSYTTAAYADNFVASVPEYSLTPLKQIQPTPTEAAATASGLDATAEAVDGEPATNAEAVCAETTATAEDAAASIKASAQAAPGATGIENASGVGDAFGRADAATLGTDWSEEGAGFSIASFRAVSDGGPLIATMKTGISASTVPTVYGTVQWWSGLGGVFIASPSNTPTLATLSAYSVETTGTGVITLAKYVSGAKTVFGTYSGSSSAGWYLTVEQVSSALYARFGAGYPAGTNLIAATDTSIPLQPSTNYYGGLISAEAGFTADSFFFMRRAGGYFDASVTTSVPGDAQTAEATAAALDPTAEAVDGSTDTNVDAIEATATAAAQNPNPDVQASAEYAYADGLVSVRAGGHVAPSAAEATAQAAAHDLAVLSSPVVEAATALADAQGANGSQEANAVEATATAAGLDPTVETASEGTQAFAVTAEAVAACEDVGGGDRRVGAEPAMALARKAA